MGGKKKFKKFMAMILSVVMVVGLTQISVMAETGSFTDSISGEIVSIDITGKDTYAIQSEITAALIENDTVNVIGSKVGVIGTLQLTIPEGKRVAWQAEYVGDISRLISINGGGYFLVEGNAAITNNGYGGTAINAEYTSPTVMVSGGTVSASGENGTVIQAEYESFTVIISGGAINASGYGGIAINSAGTSSKITVSGGKVSSIGEYGTAIYTPGNVEVSGTAEVSASNIEGWAVDVSGDSSKVTVKGGTVSANNPSGIAINAQGAGATVTVSGGTVSANNPNGFAINAQGASSTVTVSGGTVSAMSNAISAVGDIIVAGGEVRTDGQDATTLSTIGLSSTVTVSGGTISASGQYSLVIGTTGDINMSGGIVSATGECMWAIYAMGENSAVKLSGGTVSGPAAVRADGASPKVTVSGNATIRSDIQNGIAIFSRGDVEVSGGKVTASGKYGKAIYTHGASPTVTVRGDAEVIADGEVEFSTFEGGTIYASGNMIIEDNAVVEATGENACAIHNYGASSLAAVNGGQVRAIGDSSCAIYADSESSAIEVSDGAVFAYGDKLDYSIFTNNPSGFTLSNKGVVIVWKQSAGRTSYDKGLSTNLILSYGGDTATALWDMQGSESGIAYENGENKGFIPVMDVTVSALSATVNGSEVTFNSSEKTASVTVPNSVSSIGISDVSVTVGEGTTWRLYMDSACTQEAVMPYNLNIGANILYLKIDDGDGHFQVYTATVTRRAVPVTGIMVTGGSSIDVMGGTLQLTANVVPTDATNKGVTWSIVSGGAYAAVSSSGLVTATANGTVTVRATAQENSSLFSEVQITISGQGGGGGGADTPDYIQSTLTDGGTGVTASGNIREGAVLTIGHITLGNDTASNTIRMWMKDGNHGYLLGVDISLSGSFTGELTISLPIGAQYNGQTVTILHAKKDFTLETYTAIVQNGKATFNVTSLSPFAVFTQVPAVPAPTSDTTPIPLSNENKLDDIPKTGDHSSQWVWWLLCVVSAAGIATLTLWGKRKRTYKN